MRVHGETFLRPRPKPWAKARSTFWNSKDNGPCPETDAMLAAFNACTDGVMRPECIVTPDGVVWSDGTVSPLPDLEERPFPASLNCRCEYCVKERESKP